MKETVCQLRLLIHIDDVQDEYTSDFTGYHIAVHYSLFSCELLKEVSSVSRPVTLESDSHNRCQTTLHTVRSNDRDNPLYRADFLEVCDSSETR